MPREKRKLEYNEKLMDRYADVRDVKRIARHRHLPKNILRAKEKRVIMDQAAKRKRDNVIKHSKPGSVKIKAERNKYVIKEED